MSVHSIRKNLSREDSVKKLEDAKKELELIITQLVSPIAVSTLRWAIANLDRGKRKKNKTIDSNESIKKKQMTNKLNNSASRDFSVNRFQRWTDEHDRIIIESTLVDSEVAKLIGRTICAVRVRRNFIIGKTKTPA